MDTGKAPQQEDLVEAFAASNIDDALELMETINARSDKASVGTQAAGIERHPEVRRVVSSPPFTSDSVPIATVQGESEFPHHIWVSIDRTDW